MIRAHQRQLQTQLMQLQAQMQAFDNWTRISPFFESEANWEITYSPAFYFLPQADFDAFSDDKSVHQAAKSWLPWMPIVQSAIRYNSINIKDPAGNPPILGFTVPADFARTHNMYLDSPVEYVEPQRWLVIYMKDQSPRPDAKPQQEMSRSRRNFLVRTAWSIMEKHSFQARDDHYYIMKLLQLTENDTLTNYSIMQIPLV